MVEYLKMHITKKQYLLAWCLVGLATTSVAETLRDPTMPPAQLLQKSGVASESYSGPVLQSTKLGEPSNAVMISGEMVSIGQQYRGAKLVKVTENSAELKGADGKQQILSMNYPIERKWRVSEPLKKPMDARKLKTTKSNNQVASEKYDE